MIRRTHENKRLQLALAAALAAWPVAHFAQTADPDAAARTLAEVLVVDRHDAQRTRKAALVQRIVYTEEDVERYGDATVGDVLRRLPGLTFTGPAGVTKDVRMRGLDKGYTLFLINGEPVPGAVQDRQMQVDRLPADMIERIEIVRNPSAEYDAGGIGGTINIVLKSRAEDLTRLRAAYGRNGDLDVGDAIVQWSRRLGSLDAVIALSHTVGAEDIVEDKAVFNSAGALTQREHKPRPVAKSETLFAPRLAWRRGDDLFTLDPLVSHRTEDKLENAAVRNAAGAATRLTTNDEDKTDRIARLSARYDGTAGWGRWHAKFGVQQGSSEKDRRTIEADGSGAITRRTEELEDVTEDQAYAGAGIAVALGAHVLKSGIELRAAEFDKRKTKAEARSATGPLVPAAPGPNDIYRVDERRAVVWLQDDWQFGRRHTIVAGARFERIERDAVDAARLARSGASRSSNPSLHYRWAVTDSLNLRASAARTLRLPKFDDVNPQVQTRSGTPTDPDKGGNPTLQPERAVGVELGFERFLHGDRGVIAVNFYNREVRGFVEKVATIEDGRYVERPRNVGDAHFWGGELDLRQPLLHKGAHVLTLAGSHAELRGRIASAKTSNRRDVKDLPRRVSNLALDWTHRPSRWSAGFAVNHVPRFTNDSVNDDGARETKTRNESTLLDLYVGKAFGALAELRLIAKNVFAVDKAETTTKYAASGAVSNVETKVERSQPTVFVTFESRF